MRRHFVYQFQIAGILIRLESDICLKIEPKFHAFQKETGCPELTIRFRQTECLPQLPENVVYEGRGYRVHADEEGHFFRAFADLPRDDSIYAVASYDYAGSRIHVDYLQTGIHCVADMSKCFAHIFFLCAKNIAHLIAVCAVFIFSPFLCKFSPLHISN